MELIEELERKKKKSTLKVKRPRNTSLNETALRSTF